MEEMCPHLGAPLSHAELEDIEDSMAIGAWRDMPHVSIIHH
jgi:hypothetical protein